MTPHMYFLLEIHLSPWMQSGVTSTTPPVNFEKFNKHPTWSGAAIYMICLQSIDQTPTPTRARNHKDDLQLCKERLQKKPTRQYANIRTQVSPTIHSGLQFINVPVSKTDPSLPPAEVLSQISPADIVWEKVIDREAIEAQILKYNSAAFRAADESPCGHGIIHDELTFTSLSPSAQHLLSGHVPPEWHKEDAQLEAFFASFAVPDHVRAHDDIPSKISSSDIEWGIKKWRESTATSPSGRHLGHYKALITDPILLDGLTKFLNIAISHGISVKRWSKAVNVLIEKDPGLPNINRLRIIHLFEADYNLFLKIQWGHRLVRRSVEFDLLHPGQHGSVPARSTMDPIMLTQLTTDLCRILKHNLTRFDNDASACYDRIIVNLGMLAARRCGMPLNAIQTHAEALQFMQYTVKTVHGISSENYRGTPYEPLFGTGQGSGASPAVWLSLVVILMNTLDHLIPDRMEFQSPDASITHSRLIDAFVDDTSLGFTDPGLLSYTEMITRINHIAQTWERLLHFSGGSLNLSKCSWYIMYWDWVSGRPALRPISKTDTQVQLTRGPDRETTIPVKCTSVNTASRILGVYLSPSGDFSAHLKMLKTKADDYAARLRSPRLTPQDIKVFHKTTYTPAMRYSLAAMAVDEEELGPVQSKVLAAMLQGMGVSSKLPTAIRHGPLDMGGMELLDLRTEMGIASLRLIRNSVFANSEVGKLIVMNVQYSQLEAGIGYNLLEKPHQHVSYLTPTWITSVRQFISNHAITITFTDNLVPALRTTRDQYIMDPIHLQRYTPSQQHDINLVRIYLQVTTLSNMSAGTDGRSICNFHAKGARPPNFSPSPTWPRQETPSLKQTRLWNSYIATSYIRYHPYWAVPLGTLLPTSGYTPQPCTDPLHTPQEATSYTSLRQFLKAIPRFYSRLLLHYEQIATDLQIWKAFRSKQRLEIVTDGSLESKSTGTFGWKLITPKNVTLYQGTGPVEGPPEISSSTRSELGGFAAPLLLIAAIARFWGLRHKCRYRWIMDSQCAITKVKLVTYRGSKPRRQLNNIDYLSLIASLHTELRSSTVITWVKSHQDQTTPYSKLSRDARNNVDVDALAATHSKMDCTKPIQQIPHLPILRVTMTAGGIRLMGNFDDYLRFHVNGSQLRVYMQDRFQWTNDTWDTIDHVHFGTHFRSLTSRQQVTHMKFVYDQQPLGYRLLQRATIKSPSISLCPCCSQETETQNHFLLCSAHPSRTLLLRAFTKSLHDLGPHSIFYVITDAVNHWFTGSKAPYTTDLRGFPSHMHEKIQTAITEQSLIGWEPAIKGFLSSTWHSLASLHMHNTDSVNWVVGTNHMRAILTALHSLTNNLWKARNEIIHAKDKQTSATRHTAEQVEIQHYYDNRKLLLTEDQHYCDRPIDTILNSIQSVRRRWLRQVQRSRAARLHDHTLQQTVTQYYPRSTPSPHFHVPAPAQAPAALHPNPPPPVAPPPVQMSILRYFSRR